MIRTMMRTTVAVVLFVGTVGLATAGLITFEEMPAAGPVENFYADLGVHFDDNWRMLEGATATYPTHSGDNLVYTTESYGIIDFDAPVVSVSGWFTSSSTATPSLLLEAYDSAGAAGTLLGKTSMDRNPGSISFMSVEASGILSVKIHDSQNYFTMDDFAFIVPEPSTLLPAGVFLIGLVLRARKK
jgi:hypothetical protein